MTIVNSAYAEITEARLLPQLVRLRPNLYAAVFTLMKLVPARYILRRAAQRGQLGPSTTVVETTSGTFGLALAMQTALMRRKLVLVSDPVIDESLRRRLEDLGASVDIVPRPAPNGGYQGARLERLAMLRAELPDTFCPEQYSNPDNPGSYAIVADLLAASLGQVDCVVGPVGSGGSMCGTVGFLREHQPELRAIAVDTHRSALFGQPEGPRLLRGLGNSLMPANLRHETFDEVHWCSAAEANAATRRAHQQHALFAGPTSGAALLVAEWWAARNPDALCVAVLPDEGYRYLATTYDDRWIDEQGLRLAALPEEPVEVPHPAGEMTAWSWFPWRRRRLEQVVGVPGAVA
jgi:cysteine synthase A